MNIPDRNYNDKRYKISFSKLTKLGWKQQINIQEGLKKVIHNIKQKKIQFSQSITKKIYILGHKGWIGQMYLDEFKKLNIPCYYSDFRAESKELIQDILDKKITHVLSCMGRTHGTYKIQFNTIDYLQKMNYYLLI